MSLDRARRVADAVLYEGYVLFPYRASARKNRLRWQFGVLVPAEQATIDPSETAWSRCECLVEATESAAAVSGCFRALRPRRRTDPDRTVWDEGEEVEVPFGPWRLRDLLRSPQTTDVRLEGSDVSEPDGVRRTTEHVHVRLEVWAERTAHGRAAKLVVRTENVSPWSHAGAPREDILLHSVVGTHTLLEIHEGAFVSLLDPPAWAQPFAARCHSEHTHPVLAGDQGDRSVVLAAPIILYDHPEVAPESPGDSFDATEIDELLTLTVRSLTDAEKEEARRTDPRAAAIVDRADSMPAEVLERLHGAIRTLEPAPDDERRAALDDELAEFFGIGEEPLERTAVGGVEVAVGDTVVLWPSRRADAQDAFVRGRRARVGRILADVDGGVHVGVTLEDDPGADLHDWYGRYLWYQPDEIELADRPTAKGAK